MTPIDELRELIAAPSVSTNPAGQAQARAVVQRLLEQLGAQVTTIATGGAPALLGVLPGAQSAGLLFYGHYDVMTAGTQAEWASAPFTLTERNGRLFGRGTGDNKGQLVTTLAAVAAYTAEHRLHHTLYFLIEGEEEQGSVHLAATVGALRQRLAAVHTVLVIDGSYSASGAHVLRLGNRGIVTVKLHVTTAKHANHSGYAGNVIADPGLLLQAMLNRLVDPLTRQVKIPGFYTGVTAPTPRDWAAIDALPFAPEGLAATFGTPILAKTKREYYAKLMFQPTFDIAGVASGDVGPGAKTIIPGTATASLNLRLVGDQQVAPILAGLRHQLAPWLQSGELTIEETGSTPPAHTQATPAELARFQAAAAAAGVPLLVEPCMPGTVPNYVWTQLGAQVFTLPLANFDEANHAPNENIDRSALTSGQALLEAVLAAYDEALQRGETLVH
ncbi:M20/M25/M40 family metallo-hydrolase [Lacticaseibacillus nasuensis]|uniref:Peptidase M20 n=1 Tax=Lacticaseibacillus nasuensis JCM 17158 TaxID=1291734 RepID=A0A0R1JK89_9LACO|nr:M20/M25/M40 family metallo-hydrolase [Lacticaseibacillus nasuensis]KRK71840.1 peptidase M20 [Lacticaseibacillus nasuensis JCM 17158]